MATEERGDRFRELEETYRDYTVYDQHYERIGRVDDIFVDEYDRPEYIGVKTGFLGMKSTLIPMEIARVNDRRRLIEVAADKRTIESAPAFDDDEEITPDQEARIYGYFGLEHPGLSQGGYGDYYDSEPYAHEEPAGAVDTEYGERRDEPLMSPAGGETFEDRETFDTPSASGPIEGDRDEPGMEPAGAEPGAGPSSDEPARFEETQTPQTGTGDQAEGQGTSGVRVYKRVRGDR